MKEHLGQVVSTSARGASLALDLLRTARSDVRTHTRLHTQYLQQNTEEMDLLRSPDATQSEGKQNEKEGKTKERMG